MVLPTAYQLSCDNWIVDRPVFFGILVQLEMFGPMGVEKEEESGVRYRLSPVIDCIFEMEATCSALISVVF